MSASIREEFERWSGSAAGIDALAKTRCQDRSEHWLAMTAFQAGAQSQQAKIDELRAMLKEVEWGGNHMSCCECKRYEHVGHATGCKLAELIKG